MLIPVLASERVMPFGPDVDDSGSHPLFGDCGWSPSGDSPCAASGMWRVDARRCTTCWSPRARAPEHAEGLMRVHEAFCDVPDIVLETRQIIDQEPDLRSSHRRSVYRLSSTRVNTRRRARRGCIGVTPAQYCNHRKR